MVSTSRAQPEATHPRAQYFWESGLLAYGHGSRLRGRLLIKHFWGLTVNALRRHQSMRALYPRTRITSAALRNASIAEKEFHTHS